MVGSTSSSVTTTEPMSPSNPNQRSFAVAWLAASHQIAISRQHSSGPNSATIQKFDIPPSIKAGPNRATNISPTRSQAGQVRSGRGLERFPDGSGAASFEVMPANRQRSCGLRRPL